MKTESSVVDKRKLSDEEIGKLFKKTTEIIRRISEGTILYEDSIEILQKIVIEKTPNEHKLYLGTARGTHQIKEIEHEVNCDESPMVIQYWKVVNHKKRGLFKFKLSKLSLFKFKKLSGENEVQYGLRKESMNTLFLNANVLDYLLAHPHLIPNEWVTEKKIVFRGTAYYNHDEGICFRALSWDSLKGSWGWCWIFCAPYNEGKVAAIAVAV
ncbi:MAG: hypothetical protein WCK59_04730 [Candidatus Falkowbacteria bacterium]